MGIITPLDPVLSFPLGSNAISITEAALAYQCIMTGHKYPFAHNSDSNPIPVITKIFDRSGELLYEYKPEPEEILPKAVRDSANEILRMVIEKGTGRQARGAVKMPLAFEGGKVDLPIPCFGKTGTSNDYRNSSFVGYIPGLTDFIGTFDLKEGYVIAGYVGYDDNRPMKGKHMTIYGASGALPLWIDIANQIVSTKEYRKELQLADFAFDSRTMESIIGTELEPIDVSITTGLPVTDSQAENFTPGNLVRTYGNIEPKTGEIILRRVFNPF
jgi:membrane peptidoglycan carboxypeptidase